MLYNSTFCRNLTAGNNTSGVVDARCEQDRALTGNSDDGDTTPVIIAIVITALYSIVCVVGLVGNVLVMYVIIRLVKHTPATRNSVCCLCVLEKARFVSCKSVLL